MPDLANIPIAESDSLSPDGTADGGGQPATIKPDMPSLQLKGKQVGAMGLGDAKDGDMVSLKVKGRVTKDGGMPGMDGVTLDIMSAMKDDSADDDSLASTQETGDGPMAAKDRMLGKSKIMSPDQAGLDKWK